MEEASSFTARNPPDWRVYGKSQNLLTLAKHANTAAQMLPTILIGKLQ